MVLLINVLPIGKCAKTSYFQKKMSFSLFFRRNSCIRMKRYTCFRRHPLFSFPKNKYFNVSIIFCFYLQCILSGNIPKLCPKWICVIFWFNKAFSIYALCGTFQLALEIFWPCFGFWWMFCLWCQNVQMLLFIWSCHIAC